MNRLLVRLALLLPVLLVLGCAGKPSLPRHASIERVERPPDQTNFAVVVESADVIYFPSDRAVFGARTEPAALLMEALERSGHPFAIGWDLIDASQQPVLDQLPASIGPAREELIRRLELVGSGRTQEHCRAVLRNIRAPGVNHLALRLPASLIARLAAAQPLSPEEEQLLPRGYKPPPGGLESYAERLRAREGGEEAMARSYHVELVRRQFIAEKIARQIRGAGGKLVVFLAASDLRSDEGVPFYVAQKARVRQLVLAADGSESERPRLLTGL